MCEERGREPSYHPMRQGSFPQGPAEEIRRERAAVARQAVGPFPVGSRSAHVGVCPRRSRSQARSARSKRAEPRRRVLRSLTGLLSTAERKHGWQLAELAGETTPDGMQRLLSTAHWAADAVRDDRVACVLAHLADPQAVLVLEETGCVTKGSTSVGVAPQYGGTVGKIATGQIGVFLASATRQGPVRLDRELYLPREWAPDPARRAEAGVPGREPTPPAP